MLNSPFRSLISNEVFILYRSHIQLLIPLEVSAQYTSVVELFHWGHCSSISSGWGFHHLRWRPLQDGSAPSTSASETNDWPCLFDIAYKFSPTPPSPQMSAISKARIQSVGRRQHAGVWFSSSQGPQSVEKWDSTSGWPGALRAHHTPLGEGLVSPKPCLTQYTTNQLVPSSFITCGNICEAHQAEEKRKLKAISSQRPEFPCPTLLSTHHALNPCCLPSPRKSHSSRNSSSDGVGKRAAAVSQEAVRPPRR